MPIEPPLLKHINRFARRHIFFTAQSLTKYTTSQRRKFERDIYDHARAIALSKAQAKKAVIYTRRLCGEEEYDSDSSRLDDDEVDDSAPLRTPPEDPWYFSLDWSFAATTDAAKPPQTSTTSETANKRPQVDFGGSSEKRRKVNGVMTSSSQGADRPPDSVTRKDEGGHHPTENIAAHKIFSKHLTHTPSGYNSSTEQLVRTPGLPESTGLVSSTSQVDTSLTIKDKRQNGHEGAQSSEERLSGTSSIESERQGNIQESTSAIEDISSKVFEKLAKEPSAAVRSLDESKSQEQNKLSVVKEVRNPKQSNVAHHNHQLLSTSSLTQLDQQANNFTHSPLNNVHAAKQKPSEEQCEGEYAIASTRKPDQIVLDSTTLRQDPRVANSSIQLSSLRPGGGQLAEGVQSPNVKEPVIEQSVQSRPGYAIETEQKINQHISFERYNKITNPWHPPADRSIPIAAQNEVHRSSCDPSHRSSRSNPNNESDPRVTHGDHNQAMSIADLESEGGSADGAQREADGSNSEQSGTSDVITGHGYSLDAADEKSGGAQTDHIEESVRDMQSKDGESSQGSGTELKDGLVEEDGNSDDEQADSESDEADSHVAAWIEQTNHEPHRCEGFAGSTKESVPPKHDEEDPKPDRLRCTHCKIKFARKSWLLEHLLKKHPLSLRRETLRRLHERYSHLDEETIANPEMTLESSVVRKSDGPLTDSRNHQNAMVQ